MEVLASASNRTLFSTKSALAWVVNPLEGVVPHSLLRAVMLNPLETEEAATREEPKPSSKERAAVNNIG